MTKKQLLVDNLRVFGAVKNNAGSFVTCIMSTGEHIINPISNFLEKADYYEKVYDDDLVLISNKKIRIDEVRFNILSRIIFNKDNGGTTDA